MGGIFKPGQLVKLNPVWGTIPVDLYLKSHDVGNTSKTVKCIGKLYPSDVAIIVSVANADRSAVYIICSHGNGWTPSGLLKIIRQPDV